MSAVSAALQFVGFTIGASLDVFLVALLIVNRVRGLQEKLALATLLALGLWHTSGAITVFQWINGEPAYLLLEHLKIAGIALAPSLFLHLALVWAKFRTWFAIPVYAAAPAVWWLRELAGPQVYDHWVAVSMMAAAALCFYSARLRSENRDRMFFRILGGGILAIPIAGAVGPASVVWASLAPPLTFAYFVYRYNFLGLLIPRRLVFALTLGVTFALYLLIVRRVADLIEKSYETLLPGLVETVLIIAATLVWLPLYLWITRFLSKRTQIYADFSKRLIEEAARILDLEQRLQFLAGELGRTFAVPRVLLSTAGEPALRGEHPRGAEMESSTTLDEIKSLVLEQHQDVINTSRAGDPHLRALVAGLGFNYLFPLWYEDHLEGLLFLDTFPKLYLDENEPILLGLSRQISHSIETCRVIEEKIGLEKALARQEHLASLGMAAATIAHEIKNPLSSIKTLAQLMREDFEVREKYDRDLTFMIGETNRLNSSVQQLLSFSRPVPEQIGEVDLTELLETMGDFLARQCENERIQIERKIAPGLKLRRANPEIIKQVVLNLVLNAMQASQSGDKVDFTACAEPQGHISIAVSDQGPGIPEELRKKIFQPFFTTKQKGTGLGLAIVWRNVRHLDGEVRIESPVTDGKGARFIVLFPIQ
jgi:signal transduction histidine kinase